MLLAADENELLVTEDVTESGGVDEDIRGGVNMSSLKYFGDTKRTSRCFANDNSWKYDDCEVLMIRMSTVFDKIGGRFYSSRLTTALRETKSDGKI